MSRALTPMNWQESTKPHCLFNPRRRCCNLGKRTSQTNAPIGLDFGKMERGCVIANLYHQTQSQNPNDSVVEYVHTSGHLNEYKQIDFAEAWEHLHPAITLNYAWLDALQGT